MTHKTHTYPPLFATVLAVLLTLFVGPVAGAMPSETDHGIEIHKVEQPGELGAAADGLPQDVTGHTPVQGSTFTAQRVPGIDVLTPQGQREAGNLSLDEASQRVAGREMAAQEVTDAQGRASLSSLASGVYYVQETDTPAGYVGSEPFLVVLPLTHPIKRDDWLSTVHVYPKDAKTGVTLDVIDEDAVTLGDRVQWISRSDIPRHSNLDGYRVDQVINSSLSLIGANDLRNEITVSLDCTNCPDLVADVDYTLSHESQSNVLTTTFTAAGLEKLTAAIEATPTAQVKIEYETTVHEEGVHVNEAIIYPSQAAIDKLRGVHDTAITKWGSISILVHERDHPENLIPGARFELFLTLENAHARQHPIVIDGNSEWTTDDQGRVIIHGLRFSNFVNGLDRETSDPLYRLYWVAPAGIAEGWSWVDETPLAGAVTDSAEYQTLIFEVLRTTASPEIDGPMAPGESPAENGIIPWPSDDELPMTGGQMIGLLVLAVVLVGTGLLLVQRRRAADNHSGNQVS
jgi:LPXTG-motif cell wall-anchored protein